MGAWHILQAASVPCGGVKIKTSVAFLALAQADVARLTPPDPLPITRLDPRIRADARFGGVSRAAKGADCKSAGLAFVGSSPTSPTTRKKRFCFYLVFGSSARTFPLGAGIDFRLSFSNLCIASTASRRRSAARV